MKLRDVEIGLIVNFGKLLEKIIFKLDIFFEYLFEKFSKIKDDLSFTSLFRVEKGRIPEY